MFRLTSATTPVPGHAGSAPSWRSHPADRVGLPDRFENVPLRLSSRRRKSRVAVQVNGL
ncbi:hypothetical protein [uncultured Algimonas sp.]|uniref:hypothetical protein n=1 Tax=uncultured Algimonas sp. TaxID=1547920 RepID=UPI002610EEEF|nr:hypothetical protein [uncultured Algimonas sp.]